MSENYELNKNGRSIDKIYKKFKPKNFIKNVNLNLYYEKNQNNIKNLHNFIIYIFQTTEGKIPTVQEFNDKCDHIKSLFNKEKKSKSRLLLSDCAKILDEQLIPFNNFEYNVDYASDEEGIHESMFRELKKEYNEDDVQTFKTITPYYSNIKEYCSTILNNNMKKLNKILKYYYAIDSSYDMTLNKIKLNNVFHINRSSESKNCIINTVPKNTLEYWCQYTNIKNKIILVNTCGNNTNTLKIGDVKTNYSIIYYSTSYCVIKDQLIKKEIYENYQGCVYVPSLLNLKNYKDNYSILNQYDIQKISAIFLDMSNLENVRHALKTASFFGYKNIITELPRENRLSFQSLLHETRNFDKIVICESDLL